MSLRDVYHLIDGKLSQKKLDAVLGILRDNYKSQKKLEAEKTKFVLRIEALKRDVVQRDKEIAKLEEKLEQSLLEFAEFEMEIDEPEPKEKPEERPEVQETTPPEKEGEEERQRG